MKKRFIISIVINLIIIVFIGLAVSTGIYPRCPTYEIFHWNCAGCGSTRMVLAMLNGNIYQAFRFNPLMFIMLPYLGGLYVYENVYAIKHGELSKYINEILEAVIIILVIYSLIRNIWVFKWLSPTYVG